MEFRDLKQQYKCFKEEIDDAISCVLNDANFISGKQVGELERQLAEYVGVKYCITCANGTDALQLALMAWGVGPGDAVFVPDFTFFSSAEVVPCVGATPIFVDIDKDTFNISVESLADAIKHVTEKTDLTPKVIIAVDLFGQPADFEKIDVIAQKYGMFVLEDAAQGFGGKIGEKRACSFGKISTTSFFPAKPLGCYGDGGAIFTDNDDWAELLKSYKVHGKGLDKYDNVRIGMNSRLDTIQAAVLLVKLKHLDEEITKCNRVSEWYSRRLKESVKVPMVAENMYSSWAQYTICLQDSEQRESVAKSLRECGVPTAIYYKKPMHNQKAFSLCMMEDAFYVNSTYVSDVCLSLPMHAYISEDEIDYICDVIRSR